MFQAAGEDVEFFRRRLALSGKVLPIPLHLEPGENLRDGILRAVSENGHSSTAVVAKLSKSRTFQRLSAFKSMADHVEIDRLLDVLGLSPHSELVCDILQKPLATSRGRVGFFGKVILRSHITTARRVSPRALTLRNYQRALWSIAPIDFDTQTGEILLDRCPNGHALTWIHTSGVAKCGRCAADLRECRQPTIEPSDGEALRFVTGTIDPLVSDDEFRRFHTPIAQLANRSELFQFAVRIGSACHEIDGEDQSNFTPTYANLEHAGRAILNWPDAFVNLAERLAANSTKPVKETILGRLRLDPTICAAVRFQLRKLFDTSKRKCAAAIISNSGHNPDTKGTLTLSLKQPRAAILKMIRDGVACGDPTDLKFRIIRDIASVREASRVLGLPITDIIELFRAGFLTELRQDLLSIGIDHSVSPFEYSLRDALFKVATHSPLGMPLSRCRFALDVELRGSWSTILEAAVAGTLKLQWFPRERQGLVQTLRTRCYQDMARLVQSSEPTHHEAVALTQAELGLILGCSIVAGASLVRSQLIAGPPTTAKFSAFRREYVLSSELKDLMKIHNVKGVPYARVLRQNGLEPISVGSMAAWRRSDALSTLSLVRFRA